MKKFWNWIKDSDDTRTLRLEGPIDEESFWGDEITPQMFLQSGDKQVELPDVFNDPATRAAALAYLVESVKSDMAQLADLCWRLEA